MSDSPIDWLFSLASFGIKFGLDNIRAIVGELGRPERAFRSIHVAGTNGKGSVTAMLEASLREAGYRTGRYTSPHLLHLAERFAINGVDVGDDGLADAVSDVRAAVSHLQERGGLAVHPTFFEVTTAVAFELFRRHRVDVAVCEVGLGGRLDATNVLSPMACAITSIALDHQQYLGHTLVDIAREKAGIIKSGVPVLTGPLAPDAQQTVAAIAHERGAPMVRALDGCAIGPAEQTPDGRQRFFLRTPDTDFGRLTVALAGAHQVVNSVLAVRVLEVVRTGGLAIDSAAIARGLASVRWPGRLQQVRLSGGREALLDAAHNEAGAEALAAHLATLGARRPLVFAAMRDKDAAAMVRALAPVVSAVVVTRASNPRSADPGDLAALVRSSVAVPVRVVESPAEAVARAFEESRHIVVAGSIFLLADVMKEFGPS